jgi:hypothetical protein
MHLLRTSSGRGQETGLRGDLPERSVDLRHTSRVAGFGQRANQAVYGETEIGGTSWMYLAPTDFVNTELPKLQTEAIPTLTETIQHGVFKSFVPPLALYGLLGLIMHSLRESKDEEEKNDERD